MGEWQSGKDCFIMHHPDGSKTLKRWVKSDVVVEYNGNTSVMAGALTLTEHLGRVEDVEIDWKVVNTGRVRYSEIKRWRLTPRRTLGRLRQQEEPIVRFENKCR